MHLLADLFLQTAPREIEQRCFFESFVAFKREAEACFSAGRTIESAIVKDYLLPASDGSQYRIGFTSLYVSLDVLHHARIFRMTAKSIIDLFPIDEVDESRHYLSDFPRIRRPIDPSL